MTQQQPPPPPPPLRQPPAVPARSPALAALDPQPPPRQHGRHTHDQRPAVIDPHAEGLPGNQHEPAAAQAPAAAPAAAHNPLLAPGVHLDGGDPLLAAWDLPRVLRLLDANGLGQYAGTFVRNDLVGTRLVAVSYHSLKDMGISNVGDRTRIVQIAKRIARDDRRARIGAAAAEHSGAASVVSSAPGSAAGSAHSSAPGSPGPAFTHSLLVHAPQHQPAAAQITPMQLHQHLLQQQHLQQQQLQQQHLQQQQLQQKINQHVLANPQLQHPHQIQPQLAQVPLYAAPLPVQLVHQGQPPAAHPAGPLPDDRAPPLTLLSRPAGLRAAAATADDTASLASSSSASLHQLLASQPPAGAYAVHGSVPVAIPVYVVSHQPSQQPFHLLQQLQPPYQQPQPPEHPSLYQHQPIPPPIPPRRPSQASSSPGLAHIQLMDHGPALAHQISIGTLSTASSVAAAGIVPVYGHATPANSSGSVAYFLASGPPMQPQRQQQHQHPQHQQQQQQQQQQPAATLLHNSAVQTSQASLQYSPPLLPETLPGIHYYMQHPLPAAPHHPPASAAASAASVVSATGSTHGFAAGSAHGSPASHVAGAGAAIGAASAAVGSQQMHQAASQFPQQQMLQQLPAGRPAVGTPRTDALVRAQASADTSRAARSPVGNTSPRSSPRLAGASGVLPPSQPTTSQFAPLPPPEVSDSSPSSGTFPPPPLGQPATHTHAGHGHSHGHGHGHGRNPSLTSMTSVSSYASQHVGDSARCRLHDLSRI
ncbi:hypothetical protein HK105_206772 [Polyrhizophydium stewartii]|uniref:SAM domain-containing protein n=1 Tax=Polyrhizophydium stewartii TaxID=2732419 RepID=A0ABR4N2S3_9FUNG